jgi:hypothetical protein
MTDVAGTAPERPTAGRGVYVNLTPDGAVRDIYVVATLHNEEAGNVSNSAILQAFGT